MGGRKGGLLCSYRKVGNMPKYQITPVVDGSVLLEIRDDDIKADTFQKFFDPVDGDDEPTARAMWFAEKYDSDHYQNHN